LLITANFLTSDFILGQEVPALLERRRSEGLTVFPVIAKPCAWKMIDWLTKMNVRPKNGRPVWSDGGSHAAEDLAEIAMEVAAIIEKADKTPKATVISSGEMQEPVHDRPADPILQANRVWQRRYLLQGQKSLSQLQMSRGMVALSALLLVVFLPAFFCFEPFIQVLAGLQMVSVFGDNIAFATISGFQVSISQSALYVFLGTGAIFFEFIIIVLVMIGRVIATIERAINVAKRAINIVAAKLANQTPEKEAHDTISNTIQAAIKSLVVLASMVFFLYYTYQTFSLVVISLLFGEYYATVNSAELSINVIRTFITMLFYLTFRLIFEKEDSAEEKAFKAELAEYDKELRRGQ
jgi:hypothetical protein